MNATHGDAARPCRSTVTFYRYRNVRVTDRLLVVDGREYPLAELSDLQATRGPWLPLRRRAHELHAVYRGHLVVLLTERQAVRFNQICRALIRALRHANPTG